MILIEVTNIFKCDYKYNGDIVGIYNDNPWCATISRIGNGSGTLIFREDRQQFFDWLTCLCLKLRETPKSHFLGTDDETCDFGTPKMAHTRPDSFLVVSSPGRAWNCYANMSHVGGHFGRQWYTLGNSSTEGLLGTSTKPTGYGSHFWFVGAAHGTWKFWLEL